MGFLYLACQFSHNDPATEHQRYQKCCRATAKLIAARIPVFSPLCNSVPAVELGGLEASHDDFMAVDLAILHRSDEILILGLEGWEQSLGVKKEMFEALSLRKPITLIDEADIENLPAIPPTAKRFLKSSILPDAVSS